MTDMFGGLGGAVGPEDVDELVGKGDGAPPGGGLGLHEDESGAVTELTFAKLRARSRYKPLIQVIPDFVPVLGYLDDVILLPAGLWLATKLSPRR